MYFQNLLFVIVLCRVLPSEWLCATQV